jgi:hypothetical protein
MPTRRFEQIALAQILVGGCVVVLGACVLIEHAQAQPAPSPSTGSIGQRDLTPEEKKVIIDAVAPALRNPGSTKCRWANFPTVVADDSVNYCATVDAQSPYAAYNGTRVVVTR